MTPSGRAGACKSSNKWTNKGTYRLRKPFACRRAAPGGARCCRTAGWGRRWDRLGHHHRAPAQGWSCRTSRQVPPAWRRRRTAGPALRRGRTSARRPLRARRHVWCLRGCSQHNWSSQTQGSGSRRWTGTWWNIEHMTF